MKNKLAIRLTIGSFLLSVMITFIFFAPALFAADSAETAKSITMDSNIWTWGLVAAALATGLSSLAAGIAVASVATAAVGALSEKPELFGRLLILVGLAEGIAIYGLIVSILILNKLV